MTKVLVLGATGRQGGAVARQLVERGHDVTALVRDAGSVGARSLAAADVRVRQGDLGDGDAVVGAVRGQEAVFGLSIPFGEGGKEEEVLAGRLLVEAAADVHLVYSSVRGGDRLDETGVDHADAKQLVEAYLRQRDALATVIGPVYFMENALAVDFSGLRRGVLSTPLTPGKRLDQVAVADIAGIAVHAIEHPETMIGRRVDVASDSITGEEAAAILSDVLGRDVPYEQLSLDVVRQYTGEEFVAMWESFETTTDHLDIAALRGEYPQVHWHSYRDWAESVDWDAALNSPAPW